MQKEAHHSEAVSVSAPPFCRDRALQGRCLLGRECRCDEDHPSHPTGAHREGDSSRVLVTAEHPRADFRARSHLATLGDTLPHGHMGLEGHRTSTAVKAQAVGQPTRSTRSHAHTLGLVFEEGAQ